MITITLTDEQIIEIAKQQIADHDSIIDWGDIRTIKIKVTPALVMVLYDEERGIFMTQMSLSELVTESEIKVNQ